MKFKEAIITAVVNALLSSIFLLFKSKIIKFEKMRIYKIQSKNEH